MSRTLTITQLGPRPSMFQATCRFVAAHLLRIEPRVAAGINLDGWQFGRDAGEPLPKPVLFFNSEDAHFEGGDLLAGRTDSQSATFNAREEQWQIRQTHARPDRIGCFWSETTTLI